MRWTRAFAPPLQPEIEQFKRELAAREGAASAQGEMSESRIVARGDEHRRPRRSPWRADPLRGFRIDADRRLGYQHRHPHPRRPRLRHPAFVRTGRRARPAPAILRPQSGNRPVRRRICRHHGHPVRLRRLPAKGQADQAETGYARPRDQGTQRVGNHLPARQRLSPRSAVGEARSCFHRGQPAGNHARRTSAPPPSSWRASSAPG